MFNTKSYPSRISQFNEGKGHTVFTDALDIDYTGSLDSFSLRPSKYDTLPLSYIISSLIKDPYLDINNCLDSTDRTKLTKNHGELYFSFLGMKIKSFNSEPSCLKIKLMRNDQIIEGRTLLMSGYYSRSIRLVHFYPNTDEFKDCKPFAAQLGYFANTTDGNYNYLKIRNDKFWTNIKTEIIPQSGKEIFNLIIRMRDGITIDDLRQEDNEINKYLTTFVVGN